VRVRADLKDHQLEVWDLEHARRDDVRWRHDDGEAVFDQPDFLGDALYVLTR
jgi:hypothetical protein